MYKFIKKHVRGDKASKSKQQQPAAAPAKEEKKKAPPRPFVSQPSLQRIVDNGSREEVAQQIEDVYTFARELGKSVFFLFVPNCYHLI